MGLVLCAVHASGGEHDDRSQMCCMWRIPSNLDSQLMDSVGAKPSRGLDLRHTPEGDS